MFECQLCFSDQPRSHQSTIIDGSEVCDGCVQDTIKPKFLAALEQESRYPPRWCGKVVLKLDDYPGPMPASLGSEWHM